MPSIQGIMNRGLTIEALSEYILKQGAGKNITLQSWDKIWSDNKRIIDPVVPRYVRSAHTLDPCYWGVFRVRVSQFEGLCVCKTY